MYRYIILPILALFDPEKIHNLVFALTKLIFKIPGIFWLIKKIYVIDNKYLERELFGLTFKSPVGLAAGLDKNATLFNELGCFGFGFIEVGTVTPRPQPGNDKPRIFRLMGDNALINRMGFNNEGVGRMVERLKNRRDKSVLIGGNLGKNKVTPNEEAASDYEQCFEALFDYVDYFVVNVSSPNTPGLRALQDKEPLTKLLQTLQTRNKAKANPKPILLKIAPDLTNEQLDDIITIVKETGIAGVIATNTTISRAGLKTNQVIIEKIGLGGLSGKPVKSRSTEVMRYLVEKSNQTFPVIAVGGIFSAEDALEKIAAGASLVQVYTGFVYNGPGLVKKINKALLKNYESRSN